MKKLILFCSFIIAQSSYAFCVTNNTNWAFNVNIYSKEWFMSHDYPVRAHGHFCTMDGLRDDQILSYYVSDEVGDTTYYADFSDMANTHITIYGFYNYWTYKTATPKSSK